MLNAIVWDPDRVFFVIPYLNHPVMWYGLLFAAGFIAGYFIARKMLTLFLKGRKWSDYDAKGESLRLVDQMLIFITLGAVIGARLGHVVFYDWPYYSAHPLDIFKIWEGGLASHGGAIGVLLALILLVYTNRKQAPYFTFLTAIDLTVIPVAFAGACIRVGNFINQEITGIPTSLPWAVTFMHPLDGTPGVPVHPVQLYEAIFYLMVCGFLLWLWRRMKHSLGSGVLAGWFFLLVFAFRFAVETLKAPQNASLDTQEGLMMGQWLSIPFIAIGVGLLGYGYAQQKR